MHYPSRLPRESGHAVVAFATILLLTSAFPGSAHAKTVQGGDAGGLFRWISSFDVTTGNGSAVAEIVDATINGKQLVYTDAANGEIGFVDISDPFHPVGQGTVDVGGEPTSLVVLDPLVLVGVNTSDGDYVNPSGRLVVVHRNNRQIVATHELGGQPDALALSPDRKLLAIAIENERDEDSMGGLLPQAPTGTLLIFDLHGAAKNWDFIEANLELVVENAFEGEDLETEFVDFNSQNEIAVSFQENNHFAVVDGETGETLFEFAGGEVDLEDVDATEDDLIILGEMLTKRRESDTVAWIDNDSFATINEGDYEDASGEEGGSRGFTIYNQDGTIEYESAESFERWIASVGHYNENRSENKGCEPEGGEVGVFGGRTLLFVGSERCNVVGVYDVSDGGSDPVPLQILPTANRPEGLKAIPSRNLFVATNEEPILDDDDQPIGVPSQLNIYRAESGPAYYPGIMSANDSNGLPITWVALSDLVGDPDDAGILYTVSDSFLDEGFIYTIDVSVTPAAIIDRLQVNPLNYADGFDFEGIAVGPDGDFWLGNEGQTPGPGRRENVVLKVDRVSGDVVEEIVLPAGLVDMRRGNGIEGIAVTGEAGAEIVWVAIQRAWPNEGDTDQVNTKIGRHDTATGDWTFVHYPLEPQGNGDWIGLSSLTVLPDGTFAVIERDKGWGPSFVFNAELKSLFGVDLASAEFRAYDDPQGLVTIEKVLLRDLLPDLEAVSVWTAEKVEGFAVAADGQAYFVVDNDGVDGATGETVFVRLGPLDEALDLPGR